MDNFQYYPHLALIRLAALVGLAYADPTIAQPVIVSQATMPRVATVDQRYRVGIGSFGHRP